MDFQHIGRLCTIDVCKQKDFLPFKCSCCEKTFCQDHFRQEAHNCQLANKFANKAIVCPFCLKTIKYQGTHSETEALDIHQGTECDVKNREKIIKENEKVICESGKKCKQNLTDLNTFVCKSCDRQLCLKHRMVEEHICQRIQRSPEKKKIVQVEDRLQQIRLDEKVKTNPNILGGSINHRREYASNSYQQQTNAQYQQQQLASQQSQQEQLAQRRQQILMRYQQQEQQQQTQQQQQQNKIQQGLQNINQQQQQNNQQQQPSSSSQFQQNVEQRVQPTNYKEPEREICNECGKSFNSIMDLLSHAEQDHQNKQNNAQTSSQQQSANNSNNSNSNQQQREVCDVCGKTFNGFEELISHAEKVHFVESN